MGALQLKMADPAVMSKQLGAKENQIVQLQGQLAEKSRRLHDMEGTMESKDRAIYYLERDMDSRSRTLGKLRLRTTNLSQVAAKQNFGPEIDAKQFEVDNAEGQKEQLRLAVEEGQTCLKHVNKLKDIYERVTQQIQRLGHVNAEKVVELLQAELNALETENGQNKQLK